MAEDQSVEAFFTEVGDEFVPHPHARSPWSSRMLHGRLLGGLMARAVEREHAGEDLGFARFTVDLYRNSPFVPLRITTRRVRDGRRVRAVDVEVTAEIGPVARASALLLRRSAQPAGAAWTAPVWDVDPPELLGEPTGNGFDHWWIDEDGRQATHRWTGTRRNRLWMRERHPLIQGESVSPFVRTALAADMASPVAHFGSGGPAFINADYSVNLARLPLGEVIGIESAGHLSEGGIAAGHCTLYDASGPFGHCAVSAIHNPVPR
ncbi:thioesterase family protein [Actinomadura craniellae]|uniref:Thioesterase family protein n=1 Tax=Actinomadura craniellae TaxID=2231787 RepID=A0A365H422_9ACTN|nr:thioesterase family protein [Actinomadura craniellae]